MNLFPNWAKNILFLLVYMLSGLTLVLIIQGLLTGSELAPFNTTLENMMMHIRTPHLTNFLLFVTNIGSPFVLSSLALFLAIILILHKDTYGALLFLVAMTVSIISFTILKNMFQVTRPGIELLNLTGWSFPSGHATVATAFFFTLSHSFFDWPKSTAGKTVLIAGSILATALICFSRLYLGAHWGLDLLAGVALGLLSVSFTVLVFNILITERRWKRGRRGL